MQFLVLHLRCGSEYRLNVGRVGGYAQGSQDGVGSEVLVFNGVEDRQTLQVRESPEQIDGLVRAAGGSVCLEGSGGDGRVDRSAADGLAAVIAGCVARERRVAEILRKILIESPFSGRLQEQLGECLTILLPPDGEGEIDRVDLSTRESLVAGDAETADGESLAEKRLEGL